MSEILQRLRAVYMENPATALDMLPELFQAVDDGEVVGLPCKVGDTIYIVCDPLENGTLEIVQRRAIPMLIGVCWNDFGKTVFLTREAALAALKGEKK